MTGKSNHKPLHLRMVDNDKIQQGMATWITLQEHIIKKFGYYESLCSFKSSHGNFFSPFILNIENSPYYKNNVKTTIRTILQGGGHYDMVRSDIIRKPTMEEYLLINQIIRKADIKLNKKTSRII